MCAVGAFSVVLVGSYPHLAGSCRFHVRDWRFLCGFGGVLPAFGRVQNWIWQGQQKPLQKWTLPKEARGHCPTKTASPSTNFAFGMVHLDLVGSMTPPKPHENWTLPNPLEKGHVASRPRRGRGFQVTTVASRPGWGLGFQVAIVASRPRQGG